MSYGYLINCLFQKFSTTFFPKPSIFKTSFDTKCFNFSFKISLQLNFGSGHLVTASLFFLLILNSLTVLVPQDGHLVGKLNFPLLLFLFDKSTYKT